MHYEEGREKRSADRAKDKGENGLGPNGEKEEGKRKMVRSACPQLSLAFFQK